MRLILFLTKYFVSSLKSKSCSNIIVNYYNVSSCHPEDVAMGMMMEAVVVPDPPPDEACKCGMGMV